MKWFIFPIVITDYIFHYPENKLFSKPRVMCSEELWGALRLLSQKSWVPGSRPKLLHNCYSIKVSQWHTVVTYGCYNSKVNFFLWFSILLVWNHTLETLNISLPLSRNEQHSIYGINFRHVGTNHLLNNKHKCKEETCYSQPMKWKLQVANNSKQRDVTYWSVCTPNPTCLWATKGDGFSWHSGWNNVTAK